MTTINSCTSQRCHWRCSELWAFRVSRRCTRVHGPHDCNDTSQARARNRPHYSRNAL